MPRYQVSFYVGEVHRVCVTAKDEASARRNAKRRDLGTKTWHDTIERDLVDISRLPDPPKQEKP